MNAKEFEDYLDGLMYKSKMSAKTEEKVKNEVCI